MSRAAVAFVGLAAAWLAVSCSQPSAEVNIGELQKQNVEIQKETQELAKTQNQLRKDLTKLEPRGTYIVVDTYRNEISLFKDDALVVKDHCSTGTNSTLVDSLSGREWTFRTPRGQRTIRSSAKADPVWIRPDWAFVEEGLPPPKSYDERLEEGVLGKYALPIGDGYFIHGTLYTRLLGYPATHGCIRVGDQTLETIVKTARAGTPVVIY
jgi:L,D-transpeptidase ErfK/SrfK